MGQTCGCGGKDKQSVQDTDENEFFNENWNKAVLNDSTVGCKTIFNNDTEVIDQLVDRVTGERAVHFAVKNRNTDLLEFLLENECDTDVQRLEDGRTPLHIAAEYNHVPMIRLLLMYGCDSQIKDKNNKIARDLCSKNLKREFNNAKITALRYRIFAISNKAKISLSQCTMWSNGNLIFSFSIFLVFFYFFIFLFFIFLVVFLFYFEIC